MTNEDARLVADGDEVQVLCVTPASALDADPSARLERWQGATVDLTFGRLMEATGPGGGSSEVWVPIRRAGRTAYWPCSVVRRPPQARP